MRPGDIPSVDCTSPIKKLIKGNFISKKKKKAIIYEQGNGGTGQMTLNIL